MSELVISLHTDQHIKDAVNIYGYAYGYSRMTHHFSQYTYKKKKMMAMQNSPACPVQIFYMEPEWYNLSNMENMRDPNFKKFHDHQYKIIGTHLEATKVWSHWIDTMNSVDEIWVGNQFAADAVLNSGVTTPTFVFEHGIDDTWKPKKRGGSGKVRFLHVDSDSPRKRADIVEKAFLDVFNGYDDVELTFKHHGDRTTNEFSVMNLFKSSPIENKIRRIRRTLTQEEMVELYHNHDVLVYPSEGEGFGFIPLQALCSGMPVISTSRWCSYDKYFKDNIIESTIGPTSHTGYFEGEVVLPDYESLKFQMKKAYDEIDAQCDKYYKQASSVYKEYNWDNKCKQMLDAAIERIGIDMFKPLFDVSDVYDKKVRYIGKGTYSVGSFRFTKDDPVKEVPNDLFQSLIFNELFEEVR